MDLEKYTLDILAERILTQFDSQKYVDWAINIMQLGYESENLFILAGLDNELTAIREKYFWNTIKDFKINTLKSDTELIENYARSIAEKVIKNEINVDFAFKIMLRIVSTTNYDEKYIGFYLIDEDLDYLIYNSSVQNISGLSIQNKNQIIKEEFWFFSAMEKLQIPLKVRQLSYCSDCKFLIKPILKQKFRLKKPFKHNVWCCPKCSSENLKFNGNREVKQMIIEKYQ